ncbi:hypothetical protein ACHAXR_013490 [Thalassiosira sp. AJA248-18]
MIVTQQVVRAVSGWGKIKFADGANYVGEIENGKAHGKGKYTNANGNEYDGEWVEDKRHGTGKQTFADGAVYEGEFKDHKQHGKGKMTYTNGNVYDGEWKAGKKHGPVTMAKANGDVYKQVYDNGKLESNNKRRANPINGPPSQRPPTSETADSVVKLTEDFTVCFICTDEFTTDTNSADDDIQKHLPVLGTCDHCFCHGCVLKQQMAHAEENHGRVPKRIKCMECRREAAFDPSEPKHHKWLINLLELRGKSN